MFSTFAARCHRLLDFFVPSSPLVIKISLSYSLQLQHFASLSFPCHRVAFPLFQWCTPFPTSVRPSTRPPTQSMPLRRLRFDSLPRSAHSYCQCYGPSKVSLVPYKYKLPIIQCATRLVTRSATRSPGVVADHAKNTSPSGSRSVNKNNSLNFSKLPSRYRLFLILSPPTPLVPSFHRLPAFSRSRKIEEVARLPRSSAIVTRCSSILPVLSVYLLSLFLFSPIFSSPWHSTCSVPSRSLHLYIQGVPSESDTSAFCQCIEDHYHFSEHNRATFTPI